MHQSAKKSLSFSSDTKSLTVCSDSHFQTAYLSDNFLDLSDRNICVLIKLGKPLLKSSLNITFSNS